ncbi:MAG: beta-phosphoglucomutase [Gaiellales bacterium]|nr:beta-phosphoglucomutase [Gaiellales bacterium]
MDHPALLTTPRAVIFDFNGTISDDEPLLAELFEQIFGEVGIPVGRDLYFEEFAGYSDEEICERVLARFGRRDEDGLTERLVERRTELYLERQRERPTVSPQAAEFVRRVAERVPVAVASGAARREIEAVLGAAGIRDVFDVLVCMEDVTAGKPDPAGYLLALEHLQRESDEPIEAADVLVFEDSEQGLHAALAAGMRCIVVAGTAPAERMVGAAAVVDRLDWSIPMVEGWQ